MRVLYGLEAVFWSFVTSVKEGLTLTPGVPGLGQSGFQNHSIIFAEPTFRGAIKKEFGNHQIYLGTLNFFQVITAFNWVNIYGCSRGVIFPWRKPCTEVQVSNKFLDPSSNVGCAG